MTEELYKKHRPKSLKQMVGQTAAVRTLTGFKKNSIVPHTILLSGPSGCGKTTLARIIKSMLECSDIDFQELNASSTRGIDLVRDIQKQVGSAPLGGSSRVWLIDECHGLTKDAQSAFLKLLEDTPKHVYFLLATTDPQKLSKTIKTRCTEIAVQPLSSSEMVELLDNVLRKEKASPLDQDVLEEIARVADGSPRKGLVILNAVFMLKSTKAQLAAITEADVETQAIELARMLFGTKPSWKAVSKVLSTLTEEPESLRRMVIGYCTSIMLKSDGPRAQRAYLIIDTFRDNYFDSGKAGLAASCWEVVTQL